MIHQIDLKQLSIDRGQRGQRDALHLHQRRPSSRRKWLSRIVVPLGIVAGFLILIGTAGLQLLPAPSVRVVPVMIKLSDLSPSGRLLFRAPGWVEPRPTPINVPALTPGILESLHVVEGQSVERGQLIAKLIATDARLAVEKAQATLALREGELRREMAERDAAQLRLDKPVHLQVMLSDAESGLAAAELELAGLPHAIQSAQAQLDFASQSVSGKQAAGAAVAGIVKRRAEADYKDARAKLEELSNREPQLQTRVAALRRKVQALREQLQLLIEEHRQLEEAEAKVETAQARVAEARINLEEAQLRLARTVVASPVKGRVLRLISATGDRVMGMDTSAEHRSSTVVQLYDPIFVPSGLVQINGESGRGPDDTTSEDRPAKMAYVWIVDADMRAARVAVEIGTTSQGGLTEIVSEVSRLSIVDSLR